MALNDELASQVHDLATKLWYRFVNTADGPPGVAGPAGPDQPWDLTAGTLQGVVKALEAILERPDPLQVLRDLIDAGDLSGHFYAIREREGEGWEGPRMLKWGDACARARKLLPDSKI